MIAGAKVLTLMCLAASDGLDAVDSPPKMNKKMAIIAAPLRRIGRRPTASTMNHVNKRQIRPTTLLITVKRKA